MVKWDLVLCLLVSWAVVYVCVCKGIKVSGKVVYVTATMPYLLLFILLVRGATLPGSLDGIIYYTVPQWHRLADVQVWIDACLQVFFSLGPAWGALIGLASHNNIHNNIISESLIICTACGLSSVFAGFVIFATLGHMGHTLNVPLEKIVTSGPGLVFVVYPEVLGKLPLSSMWSAFFFLALVNLNIDGMFGSMEAVITGLADEFPRLTGKTKSVFALIMSVVFFLLGLPFVTKGGMYLFQVIDWYATPFAVMVLGLLECLVVTYVYGIGRFQADASFMLKRKFPRIFCVCWLVVTPGMLLVMFVVSALQMTPPTYGDYVYPSWAIAMGWSTAILSLIPIPIVSVWQLYHQKGSLRERFHILLNPSDDWGRVECTVRETWKQRMAFDSKERFYRPRVNQKNEQLKSASISCLNDNKQALMCDTDV